MKRVVAGLLAITGLVVGAWAAFAPKSSYIAGNLVTLGGTVVLALLLLWPSERQKQPADARRS